MKHLWRNMKEIWRKIGANLLIIWWYEGYEWVLIKKLCNVILITWFVPCFNTPTYVGKKTICTPAGQSNRLVLEHSTGSLPYGSEIDTPLNYADYYYQKWTTFSGHPTHRDYLSAQRKKQYGGQDSTSFQEAIITRLITLDIWNTPFFSTGKRCPSRKLSGDFPKEEIMGYHLFKNTCFPSFI